jgi:hypothetical protein
MIGRMPTFAQNVLIATGVSFFFTGAVVAWLTVLPRLGSTGRAISDRLCRAPLLDVIVALLTWVPPVALSVAFGWAGFLGSIVGQLVVMGAWCLLHEMAYRQASRGPRIVTFINRIVGRGRNHAALWVTVVVLPVFWGIRLGEIVLYPFLVWLLNFPRYQQSEWVNVSRHKFDGLVGHDLIWCLYCDWMTGVYSLGAEMLRNVESFWCPIRFYDGKKCANCKVDFPDIDNGWVPATGNMADVVSTMEQQYAAGRREWFGHPARLTVKGKEPG